LGSYFIQKPQFILGVIRSITQIMRTFSSQKQRDNQTMKRSFSHHEIAVCIGLLLE